MPQSTSVVLMVRPAHFLSNPETAMSNVFQVKHGAEATDNTRAVAEFDGLVESLRGAGVEVLVIEDTDEPIKPDAVFPNNWVSFHADGRVVLYPMMAPSRRLERRPEVLDHLRTDLGFDVREILDLSGHEASQQFLEGTGSMVLDRENRLAYACLSPRTHLQAAADFAQRMGYEMVLFEAVDGQGNAIYHTNVMLCVGTRLAVVCAEAISGEEVRVAVLRRLRETGHELVIISLDQMNAFAGNMLEVLGDAGKGRLLMSARACASLSAGQVATIKKYLEPLVVPVPYIEDCAGGSVRCMVAEVFLPRGH
jgi:hypothetical protein